MSFENQGCVDMNDEAIEILKKQGCHSTDWNLVSISEDTDLGKIRNVYFKGPVSIGANAEIINVPGGLANVRIGDNVRIVNVARIENKTDAKYGIGTEVAVLDETGGRPVRIYPGISSQIAALAARLPEFAKGTLFPLIDRHMESLPDLPEIGDGVEILDCGPIIDTRIWSGVKIEGASWLKNGSIVSNTDKGNCITYVGQGVNAENFIIEDASVSTGVVLRNTYVGQGTLLDKGFTSHDSLFFANCSMENGEACSLFAGPFTVSMHKSSLLIGCQTAFMNAGSGTNMSNHMYKLGPLHWGVLERGVKTSSNSYLMHGSRIGAFSLVMGEHKNHPDTSDFPFSYLFGDGKGNTSLVPAAMLKSFGLRRDQEKWQKRDRRDGFGLKFNDRITFHSFNPYTMGYVLNAITLINKLLSSSPNDLKISYNGININRASLKKARYLYELSIYKYLHIRLGDKTNPTDAGDPNSKMRWYDIAGQIISESALKSVLKAESVTDIEQILDNAHTNYDKDELDWIATNLKDWRNIDNVYSKKSQEFDSIV
ncbi:MAG: DUF4954 family protein, partial [Muribaculaceae bacterium]|nr:DUF4954 family protein [Muribaculaceae bacterium]